MLDERHMSSSKCRGVLQPWSCASQGGHWRGQGPMYPAGSKSSGPSLD